MEKKSYKITNVLLILRFVIAIFLTVFSCVMTLFYQRETYSLFSSSLLIVATTFVIAQTMSADFSLTCLKKSDSRYMLFGIGVLLEVFGTVIISIMTPEPTWTKTFIIVTLSVIYTVLSMTMLDMQIVYSIFIKFKKNQQYDSTLEEYYIHTNMKVFANDTIKKILRIEEKYNLEEVANLQELKLTLKLILELFNSKQQTEKVSTDENFFLLQSLLEQFQQYEILCYMPSNEDVDYIKENTLDTIYAYIKLLKHDNRQHIMSFIANNQD